MQISAFVDGELPDAEAQLLVRRLSQDEVLRQQAAAYFAIGRAMRGQSSVAAQHNLRSRVAAALDDREVAQEFATAEPASRRFARPIAGFAIAASVALLAIFGLRQLDPSVGTDVAAPAIADLPADEAYTVPEIDYFERHSQFSSEMGNNSFDIRRVNAEIDDDAELDEQRDEIAPPSGAVPAEPTE